jgi:hypothetical protein
MKYINGETAFLADQEIQLKLSHYQNKTMNNKGSHHPKVDLFLISEFSLLVFQNLIPRKINKLF